MKTPTEIKWRTDVPPRYAPILIRRLAEHFPVESGFHNGRYYCTRDRWIILDARGWMRLDEAAMKLDQ